MRKLKQTKGITLVALILTIVILLILAVVTIRSIQGEGIIAKAMKAREDYEGAADEEQGMLDEYLQDMEGITSGTSQGGSETESNIASYTEEGVPIPKGFYYVGGTKDEGVVISSIEGDDMSNIKQGNQFVWVPVTTEIVAYGLGTEDYREPDIVSDYDNNISNLTIINNILGTGYTSSTEFKVDLEKEFNSMAESVNKNDGFYVGRYETSLNNGKVQSIYGATSANASINSANTWYGLYAYQKKYSTDSVQGSMIWGSQYDAMMSWMGDAADISIGGNGNTTRQTGTKETDKIKNVYDLYGNSYEWTLEAKYTLCRAVRGGELRWKQFTKYSW